MVAFLSYVGRYSFESKERRLFLKGSYILQQQKQLLDILDKMQDAILVISPENYNVLFSNLKAKKMFNNGAIDH